MEPSEELQRYCRLPGHAGRGLSRSCTVAELRRQYATTAADEAGVGDASPPVRGQPSLHPDSRVMTLRGRQSLRAPAVQCCPRNDFGSSVERRGGCHPVYGHGRRQPKCLLGLSEEHRWATAAEWTAVGEHIWSLRRQPAAGLGSRPLGDSELAGIAALDCIALGPPSPS
jgi:hypothetical protein